jgi:hypothetical protein
MSSTKILIYVCFFCISMYLHRKISHIARWSFKVERSCSKKMKWSQKSLNITRHSLLSKMNSTNINPCLSGKISPGSSSHCRTHILISLVCAFACAVYGFRDRFEHSI